MATGGVPTIIVDELTRNGSFRKAARKGVNNPPEVIKDSSGKRVVYFSHETIKQIQKLQKGERPHIGKKQQAKDIARNMKQRNCGCTIQQIRTDCEFHEHLLVKDKEESLQG